MSGPRPAADPAAGSADRAAAPPVERPGPSAEADAALRESWRSQIEQSSRSIAALAPLIDEARNLVRVIRDALLQGGTVLTCGNGGSASEAEHFAAELIGHFKRDRAPLPAITLPMHAGILTSIANDFSYEEVFERQVQALIRPGDVLLGFSTSGNSENVVRAMQRARTAGAITIAITGASGGRIAAVVDHCLCVPSTETARIQEAHLVVTHLICEELDGHFG